MRRILVMGSPGSGKSRFARLLGARLGLPVIHLDAHYWLPGWVTPDRDAWRSRVAEMVGGDAWVIDGNYGRTLDVRLLRADGIVWLECPRRTCLRRILWRAISGYGKTRPDMHPGCPERIDPAFVRYVWDFRAKRQPELEEAMAKSTHLSIVRIRGKSDVAAYLEAAA